MKPPGREPRGHDKTESGADHPREEQGRAAQPAKGRATLRGRAALRDVAKQVMVSH